MNTLVDLAEKLNVTILYYHDLLANTEQTFIDHTKGQGDDIFTISYTSGTSGNSKGVMLTNTNFLSGITNIFLLCKDTILIDNDDVYISYLPLAHVFDRLGVHTVLSKGGQIGFFGGKILDIISDLMLLRPTLFVSVPRLLNKVYDRVLAGVED